MIFVRICSTLISFSGSSLNQLFHFRNFMVIIHFVLIIEFFFTVQHFTPQDLVISFQHRELTH